jgi:outer membrane protein assembly factor BamB
MKIQAETQRSLFSQGLGLTCLILALLVLPGCSWFADKKVVEPAKLEEFQQEVSIRRLWSVKVGDGQGKKYNQLMPAIEGDTVYAASANGVVMAIDRQNGRTLWRKRLDMVLNGGVGAGSGMVLVGSQTSWVIALDKDNGDELWRTRVSSEVLSRPQTNGRMVVVQTIDGKLIGLNARDGQQRWVYESTVPSLTLRGTSSPLLIDNFVIAAQANGTVVSVAIDNGTLRWEQRISIPTGRSEIDRIIDIDGELYLTDSGLLLVPSFQGYLAVLDVVTGQKRWQIQESSYAGASAGFGNYYISDEKGHVKAYRTNEEQPIWHNAKLDLRRVTAPLSFSNYVAVGDFEGYVHLLSQVDGRFVGRSRVDKDGIRANLQSRGNVLYVFGNGGTLAALEIR